MNLTTQEKRKVAVYIRVSTAEQSNDGYGLNVQLDNIKKYIEMNPNLIFDERHIYQDVASGSNLNREGIDLLLEAITRKEFDSVIVWKIDRMSRNLSHLLELFEKFERNRVSFVSIQENIDFKGPIGKLIFQIFGAIAQFERELIKGRTQSGKLASARSGNYTGNHIPYGYAPVKNPEGKGKSLKIIESEAQYIKQMFEWYVYENMGDGQIATKLNEIGVPLGQYTRKKSVKAKWSDKKVRQIFHETLYKGEYIASKKDEDGNDLPPEKWLIVKFPACVSSHLFERAQIIREKRKSNRTHPDYLLSGLIKDYSVDPPKAMVGKKRNDGAFSYLRKKFTDKSGVTHKNFEVPAKQLEEYIWNRVAEALEKPELFLKKFSFTEKSFHYLEEQLKKLQDAYAEKELEGERVFHRYKTGKMSQPKYDRFDQEHTNEIEKIEVQIKKIEDQIRMKESLRQEVAALDDASAQMNKRIQLLEKDQKKTIVSLFVERVEMIQSESGDRNVKIVYRFNPSLVREHLEEGGTTKGSKKAEKIKTASCEAVGGGCRWT